ncbi:hypothetical protein HOK51_01550 [Candidatus Woesearchaeota archaeon]|jgi:hypothetical protein|nr:hypothetical protein [Candidatus Woesearchaeota archaeon]MBT6518499.1 hypothetical protein [Candidatus Woesearchaeota archaeon]MBT7368652.1 hypothetical protein [Candidatus Woesearchaeota archaeon]
MKERDLKGSDIILNLKEIHIVNIDSFSSSGCAGRVRFNIECQTKQGYCEDPDFLGSIKILTVEKIKEQNMYLLKVRFDTG